MIDLKWRTHGTSHYILYKVNSLHFSSYFHVLSYMYFRFIDDILTELHLKTPFFHHHIHHITTGSATVNLQTVQGSNPLSIHCVLPLSVPDLRRILFCVKRHIYMCEDAHLLQKMGIFIQINMPFYTKTACLSE